jgi:hypothetical protein
MGNEHHVLSPDSFVLQFSAGVALQLAAVIFYLHWLQFICLWQYSAFLYISRFIPIIKTKNCCNHKQCRYRILSRQRKASVARCRWFSRYLSNTISALSQVDLKAPCISWETEFLGAFVKFQKGTIGFVMSVCSSVCPSACPHGTTRLPPDTLSQNFVFEDLPKNCWGNSSVIIIQKE